MASESVELLRGWGGREGCRPWPLGVLGQSSSPSAFLASSRLGGPRVPTWEKGRYQGLTSWYHSVRLAGDRAKGLPIAVLWGIALPNPPLPTTPPGSCHGLFPLRPCLHPALPHPPACPDINECEGTASMRAWPDVLQHPWQLPVCGHTMSCHLPAGLQPR